jgi:hypothetical protein
MPAAADGSADADGEAASDGEGEVAGVDPQATRAASMIRLRTSAMTFFIFIPPYLLLMLI